MYSNKPFHFTKLSLCNQNPTALHFASNRGSLSSHTFIQFIPLKGSASPREHEESLFLLTLLSVSLSHSTQRSGSLSGWHYHDNFKWANFSTRKKKEGKRVSWVSTHMRTFLRISLCEYENIQSSTLNGNAVKHHCRSQIRHNIVVLFNILGQKKRSKASWSKVMRVALYHVNT